MGIKIELELLFNINVSPGTEKSGHVISCLFPLESTHKHFVLSCVEELSYCVRITYNVSYVVVVSCGSMVFCSVCFGFSLFMQSFEQSNMLVKVHKTKIILLLNIFFLFFVMFVSVAQYVCFGNVFL